MEKTAAGPVKSSSSKGEAVRKAMTRSGLGIIALSMAENLPDVPILPPRASRPHLDSSVPATSQVVQIRRTVEVPTERAGPILDSGQRAEGNGISQRVEWRNSVVPIRPRDRKSTRLNSSHT